MVILWSLEAYSDLVTEISPEDTFEIKKFVEKSCLILEREKICAGVTFLK